MRYSLREAALVSSAVTLIFFCSCERHRPDELEHGEQVEKSDAAGHEHAEKKGHDNKPGDDQSRATTAMPVNPMRPSTPAPTPAQFFPEATPH